MAEIEMTETADYDKSATPTSHASSHESGGADPIANLSPITGLIISGDGVIKWQGASAESIYLFETKVSGDTNPRFTIRADGQIQSGPGSSALDTLFKRYAPGKLQFQSVINLFYKHFESYTEYSSSTVVSALIYGESVNRFRILCSGQMEFGSGSASPDCVLSRRAANIFNTPDRFEVGTLGVANSAAGTTPGNCQNKIEVFDAAGNSLGFIAVYDAIT